MTTGFFGRTNRTPRLPEAQAQQDNSGKLILVLTNDGYLVQGRDIRSGEFVKGTISSAKAQSYLQGVQAINHFVAKQPNGETCIGAVLASGNELRILSSAITGLMLGLETWPRAERASGEGLLEELTKEAVTA